jgi:hypothetical protein
VGDFEGVEVMWRCGEWLFNPSRMQSFIHRNPKLFLIIETYK